MPRYYCDYCDTYLTHDSPSVRKQHNAGYKHKANVRTYYQQFEEQQTQSLIDQRIKEHLGQAQAFRQLGVGAPYNPPILGQRPPLPVFPTQGMSGNPQFAMRPPPLLPRPLPLPPGYAQHPGMPMPPMMPPSGAPSIPGSAQMPPVNVPGNTAAPSPSSVPPSMAPLPSYQANPAAPTSGGFESFNNHVPAPEANR